jgi:hypothetical protein
MLGAAVPVPVREFVLRETTIGSPNDLAPIGGCDIGHGKRSDLAV